MVLADFVIGVEFETPREVRVVVYDNLKGFRIACSLYENRTLTKRKRKRNVFSETLGICHRFEHYDKEGHIKPLCAIVRLAKPHLGIGIVSHELAHAAVWMRSLNKDTEPLTDENDEPFVWLIGELISLTVDKMYALGVYDEE